MSNNKIIYSIIIPTLNRGSILKKTFTSLKHLNFNSDKFEIIVVDNGSKDNTRKDTEKFIVENKTLHTIYIYEPEPGLLSGRHRGAFEARGEILVFLDDDVEVEPEWLTGIEDGFKDTQIELVGGRNLPQFEADPPEWISWFWIKHPFGKWMAELSLLDFGNKPQEIDPLFVFGLNFSIRKKTFFDLKGFNPDCIIPQLQFLQGDGETGLTRKAKEKGCKALYHPQATLYHFVPKARMTEEYFCKRYFYQGVSNSYTELRNEKFEKKDEPTNTPSYFLPIRKILGKFKRALLKIIFKPKQTQINPELTRLKEKFERARIEGFTYHREAIQKNPKLMEWVLREDYMYYILPKI